ncbi:Hypothetical Protein SiL_0837 [Sulfolobus islandicus LAL14/1]|uniref:Uncharacterized protein n=1 Tax=Saccharolobus islandicus LAL14/1 TaxID=1241935 RepID=M9U836_SACIS|nr:Hypothetical Protein SiL_0837 [Sulfolobus islandicus LAL14/1]
MYSREIALPILQCNSFHPLFFLSITNETTTKTTEIPSNAYCVIGYSTCTSALLYAEIVITRYSCCKGKLILTTIEGEDTTNVTEPPPRQLVQPLVYSLPLT